MSLIYWSVPNLYNSHTEHNNLKGALRSFGEDNNNKKKIFIDWFSF